MAAIDPSNFQKKTTDWWICSQVDGRVPQPVFCIVLSSHDTCETAAETRFVSALLIEGAPISVVFYVLFLGFENAMCYSVFCSHLNPLLYRTFPTGPLRPCAQRKMTCSLLVAVLAGHPVTRFSALHGYLQAQNLDEHDRHQHYVQSLLLCSK